MKAKIALIFAGGTIGMIRDEKEGVLKPAKNSKAIEKLIPELKEYMDLDFFTVCNLDSSNMNPQHWTLLADKIYKLYEQYDGFVVAQGTDTMAYTASALSYVFQNLSKPIVLTGSIVPLSEIGADGRNNMIYSCLVATMDIAEVCILFGNKIIRGCRAKKNHESFVDVFHSPNFPLLGEIERPIRLFDWRLKRQKRKLVFKNGFDLGILPIKLFPGFDPAILFREIEHKIGAIIIEGFGPGNVPMTGELSLLPFFAEAMKKKIPVIVMSQMERSITNLNAYEAGYEALKNGVVPAMDMTSEAVITKLMWILNQTKDYEKVKFLFLKNLIGEYTENI